MIGDVETVFDGVCRLGECPLWFKAKLYWTDIQECKIWVYDPKTEVSQVFWRGDHQIGGFAFTQNGGMVLCSDYGVEIVRNRGEALNEAKAETLFKIPFAEKERFNDITVDPEGRIFAGTVDMNGYGGVLYRLEFQREPAVVLQNPGCSNGMAFSMNEKFFFHTDSWSRRITRYRYDRTAGEIGKPVLFFQAEEDHGIADGCTIDQEDHLWVAFYRGGPVRRLDSRGKIVEEIRLPVLQPTSVIFGGPGLSDLYITSAAQGTADMETVRSESGQLIGGPVFRVHVNVSGRAEWTARL
jgi:sugar lactone lactonase YvrE